MGYVEVREVAEWIRLGSNITDRDDTLRTLIETASNWIDQHCGRSFVLVDAEASASARVFRAIDPVTAYVDDIGDEPDDLVVETSADRATWTTVDATTVFPGPLRVLTKRAPEPYTFVELVNASAGFDRYVRVTTAMWGWPVAVPEAVKTATKLLAHWLSRRPSDPYAIVGNEIPTRLGTSGDPDVRRLLAPYRRMDQVAGIA